MTDLLFAVRAIHFAATALTAGTLLFLLYVVIPDAERPDDRPPASAILFRERLLRLAWIALATAVVSGAIWFLLQAAEFGAVPLAEAVRNGIVWTVLTQTRFGTVMSGRLLVSVGVSAALFFAARSRLALSLASVLAAALLAMIAWTGHAAATPGLTGVLNLGADVLHLLAAGAWVGGLLPLGLMLIAARAEGVPAWHRIALVTTLRFSVLGIASVTTLVGTGLVNAWIQAGSVPALIGTDYGRLLLVKIAIAGAMVSVAAVNRFRLTPLLSHQDAKLHADALRLLGRNTAVELALGLAVFAVVGVLGTLPPGLHVQPDWPLPFRLNLDALADPDLRARALLAGIVALAAVALILAGLVGRRPRWLLVIGGIVAATIEPRVSSDFFVDAFPTTFRASPTTYSAESIAIGHQIFLDHCATCHGATGRGDGPAAAQAQPKADLTAEHVYDHLDGDLFWWVTNGIGNLMPAFHDVLDELMRWNVIDFVHANADGTRLRATAAKVGMTGYPVPGFSAACGDKIVDPESLRGGVVHVVFDPEGSNASATRVIDRDQALAVTTIIAARQPAEGLDGNVCVTDDPSLLDTMAIYREVDLQLMGRTEWLVDAAGLLRAMWYSEAGGDWSDDAVFAEAVLAVQRQPATPKHAVGHAHH